MGCLFLLAILLAIPTYGLSVLAFIAYVIGRAVLTAESRMRAADVKRAYREGQSSVNVSGHQSNQASAEKIKIYWDGVVEMAERRGVPAVYSNALILAPDAAKNFKTYINDSVGTDSSFLAKQTAGADYIVMSWNRMSREQKGPIIEMARQGVRYLNLGDLE